MRRQLRIPTAVLAIALAFWTAPALAMHIADGILPRDWAALWFLATVPLVMWGLHIIRTRSAIEPRFRVLVALVGAAVFVISCMPVPVPMVNSCSHPCGTGLGALLIGPGPTIVVASIALLLQALFLTHGGLTTLGANIFSMGVAGAVTAFVVFRVLRTCRIGVIPAAFLAGMLSDWATYATTAAQLSAALHDGGPLGTMFGAILLAFVPTQLPLGIAEGVVTAVAYQFILARRPDLVEVPQEMPIIAGNEA